MKEIEKKDKYLDFACKLRKLCNKRVAVIPIIIDPLGTFLMGLKRRLAELETGGIIKIIHITALLR